MVSTRSATNSPVKKSVTGPPRSKSATTAANELLNLLIAPKSISNNARFLSLPSPVDNKPKRYLFCSQAGVYELTKIHAPSHEPRSILFASGDQEPSTEISKDQALSSGYINKDASYTIATPYDLTFTLLSTVAGLARSNLFQSLDNLLESDDNVHLDLPYILRHRRALVEEAMEYICDTVEAGDERMYRHSQTKTLQFLISKAKRACASGLPASLEDRFVTRALEMPVLSVKREESNISLPKTESQDTADAATPAPGTPSESFDSQSLATSAAPSVIFSEASAASTATTATASFEKTAAIVAEESVPENIKSLQRLLTAFKFIGASYLPPSLATTLITALQAPSSGIDFSPLTSHQEHLTRLRSVAAASHLLSSFSRKRSNLDDDEENELRAEKKRKLDEDEKRKKAGQSLGVKQLAKVDTKGMKKMSAFFVPKVKGKG